MILSNLTRILIFDLMNLKWSTLYVIKEFDYKPQIALIAVGFLNEMHFS